MTRTLSAARATPLWCPGFTAADTTDPPTPTRRREICLPPCNHRTTQHPTGTTYPDRPGTPFPRPRPVGAMTPNPQISG